MSRCWCDKKFFIPECCGCYLEDPQGMLVHTSTVCYSTKPGPAGYMSALVIEVLPGPYDDVVGVSKALQDEFETKPFDINGLMELA